MTSFVCVYSIEDSLKFVEMIKVVLFIYLFIYLFLPRK